MLLGGTVLGETVQIDPGVVLLILGVLLVLLLLAVAVVVLGFVWAGRAGRGSQRALVGWAVVAVLEALVFAASGFDTGNSAFWIPLGVLAGQVATFAAARRRP
jgi:hypothetical protein